MRISTWLVLSTCVAGTSGCRGAQAMPAPEASTAPSFCQQTHEAWTVSDPELLVRGDDCPVTQCGVNGAWLGSGVAFRTLRLTPGALNPQGLRIRDFKKAGELLRFDVQGQTVRGIKLDGNAYGGNLAGSQLTLDHVTAAGTVDRSYVLTLGTPPVPAEHPFWATCPSGSGCEDAPALVKLYTFTARSSDGCEIQLCRPGLLDDHTGGLQGTAVIFRGDIYGDDYKVQIASPNSDVINISCLGTTISKMHLMRHTTASQSPSHPVPLAQRQTLMRLLIADYCGIGRPFTEEGVALGIELDHPPYELTEASELELGTGSIDAPWTSDGGVCLGRPRLGARYPELEGAVHDRIIRVCSAAGHRIADCDPTLYRDDPFATDNDGITANRD